MSKLINNNTIVNKNGNRLSLSVLSRIKSNCVILLCGHLVDKCAKILIDVNYHVLNRKPIKYIQLLVINL